MKKLKELLENNGYNYRGVKFSTHNIHYILKNTFYFGEMTFEIVFQNIIMKRLFQKDVQPNKQIMS